MLVDIAINGFFEFRHRLLPMPLPYVVQIERDRFANTIKDALEVYYLSRELQHHKDHLERLVELRTKELTDERTELIVESLTVRFAPDDGVDLLSFDLVSPVVAGETVRNALYAVLLSAVGIFFYVWWAFRNVPSPFRYGAAAIVALLHDAIIVVGIFAILGEVADMEVNTMFLIGLLTVIGYSVNDTIVVFDRQKPES